MNPAAPAASSAELAVLEVVHGLHDLFARVHDERAVLRDRLVEQDLRRAMDACDDLVCLLEGRVVLAAPVADVTRDQVVAAYFGEGAP